MNENELTHAIARDHVNLASGLLAMMVPPFFLVCSSACYA